MIYVVSEEIEDDGRQIRLGRAGALVLPDLPVVVLDELDLDPGGEVLRILPAEPEPLAGVGDDLLNELQVPTEELVGGEVVGGGGWGGHLDRGAVA